MQMDAFISSWHLVEKKKKSSVSMAVSAATLVLGAAAHWTQWCVAGMLSLSDK